MRNALNDLDRRRREAKEMGGSAKVHRQHEQGKLTVRERIDLLLDPGTFQEYGILAAPAEHRPEMAGRNAPADGVVTGFGRIDGRHVGVVAEDFTVLGGSEGLIHLNKKVRMVEIATQEKVPIVWLMDGAGARAEEFIGEGLPAVYSHIKIARLSGIAPQVAAIMGPSAGDSALVASLIEFIIMVKGTGMMAAGGPPVVFTATGETVGKEELGGSQVHCHISGVADNEVANDRDALQTIRRYLSYLPSNAWQYPPSIPCEDSPDRMDEELASIVPESPKRAYDMRRVINCVADRGSFFEIKPHFAPMMITGFARLAGHAVGIVANQPKVYAGAITAKAGQKQRHFIDLCSAYHMPLIFLVDVPGVMVGPQAEREGALRQGLAVAYSLAWSDVPLITVTGRGMAPLTPESPRHVSLMRRWKQCCRQVAEKTCLFTFLSVSHRTLPVKHKLFGGPPPTRGLDLPRLGGGPNLMHPLASQEAPAPGRIPAEHASIDLLQEAKRIQAMMASNVLSRAPVRTGLVLAAPGKNLNCPILGHPAKSKGFPGCPQSLRVPSGQ